MRLVARHATRYAAAPLAVLLTLAAIAAVPSSSGADPSLGQLSQELAGQQAHAQQLQGSLAGLSSLISSLTGQIALVQSREAALSADLARDRAQLAVVHVRLIRERALVALLRARLARARMLLARQLVSGYESPNPDLVSIVLQSHGFTDLLDRLTFLGDAERQQQGLITVTRQAKARADAAAAQLARLQAADQSLTQATAVRVRALAGMNSLLQSKQDALRRAQAVQQAALSATQAASSRIRGQISQLEAQQAAEAQAEAASTQTAGGSAAVPSGGWAIPQAIVLCESGGQNLPPNSAGASGYYQILPSTWKLFGGTGPAAYLASKAEQDAVASRIWDGGAGASNWVCAAIVGIH
jgi:septal ring factor EnvC (AmiA/AmiB activator)